MHNLWAPWRLEYVLGEKAKGCVFCIPKHEIITCEDAELLVVYRGKDVFVMLNRYPYAAGHLMIIPYRHLMDITDLNPMESIEMMTLMQISARLLREECHTDGINMGINLGKSAGAGIADHIHFHVVPRWDGDSQFIAVLSDIRLIPEYLQDTQKRFALAFQRLLG